MGTTHTASPLPGGITAAIQSQGNGEKLAVSSAEIIPFGGYFTF